MQPAVFLDRDNTLIANDGDLGDPERVRLLPGVGSGLKALRAAGYRLVVVTNQAGVARGAFGEGDVDAVNERIAKLVDAEAATAGTIDRFYYCPYHPEGTVEAYRREHPWRKPGAGMLLQAAHDLRIDLARSWIIGDQARDVLAGQSAGCRTVMIGAGHADDAEVRPTAAVGSFAEAVHVILGATRHAGGTAGTASTAGTAGSVGTGTTVATGATGAAQPGRSGPATGALATVTRSLSEIKSRPLATIEGGEGEPLRRAISDLTDEIRSQRQRRAEFTALKMGAAIVQLLAVTAAVLALLQIGSGEAFVKWMLGALMMQLITLTLLVADGRE